MSLEDISAVISKVKEILNTTLNDLSKLEESLKVLPIEAKLDVAKIEALPFTPYKSGVGSWILWTKYDDAKPLKEALEKAPNKTLDIGSSHYKLQGDKLQFVSKFPIHTVSEK